MKYKHLLFPIFSLMVLVLGCFFASPLPSPGQQQPKTGDVQPQTVYLPNFVRPNEGLSTPGPQPTPTPTISVSLLSDPTNPNVQYSIKADDGSTDGTHVLPKTILTDMTPQTVGGEVVIYGHNTDGKWVAFVSRCRNPNHDSNPKNYDVDWFPSP